MKGLECRGWLVVGVEGASSAETGYAAQGLPARALRAKGQLPRHQASSGAYLSTARQWAGRLGACHSPSTRGLPDVGASETDTLDFKTELKPLPDKKSADRFECAKDVAAFASTSGGTLLVGAVESQHVLQRYKPVSKETAAWIERENEEAVRDRCAPPPSMRTERFERDGGFVVAIHVEAFPSPVAVKVKGNGEDGWGADA